MGEIKSSKDYFESALLTVPKNNLECRCEAEYFSYVVEHLEGRREQAVQSLRAAIKRNEPRSYFYKTRLVFGLSFVHALAGHWPESLKAADHLMEFSRPNNLTYAVAWAVYMQGNASLQMGDFKKADRCFEKVYELRYIKNLRAVIDALAGHALSLQLQGMPEKSQERLQEAREFAYWTGDPDHLDVVESIRARISLLNGDIDSASRWKTAWQEKPDLPIRMFFLEYPEITTCRVLVFKGTDACLKKAGPLLDRLEEESRRFHHDCQLVPVLIIKSQHSLKQGHLQDALEILAEVVELTWPGRWILPFLEQGETMTELLKKLPENPDWGGFITRILASLQSFLSAESGVELKVDLEKSLLDELTNRETDVLVLLCDRLYDKEIADRLSISPATVKTHLTRIYNKLKVNNRREASREAKRLGLV